MGGLTHAELWRERERRRLVRLCAAVTGDRDAAEDLAQETLLEAWRNAHKLRDPAGADRWLAAIARNVCRRWARRRGRDAGLLAAAATEEATAGDFDLDLELERTERAQLIDRALAHLPAQTRDVLVHRYVHESPHAEIGALLGLSEDAVSMRLSRGKAVLRRLLESELRDEAAQFGLIETADDGWRETRVWCTECGRRRLLVKTDPPLGVAFRCAGCNPDPTVTTAEFRLGNPFFAGLLGDLIRPAAILSRTADWARCYFAAGDVGAHVPCTRCGRPAPLRRGVREAWDAAGADQHVLFSRCDACGEEVCSSLGGMARTLPEVRRFRRAHPRTRALPRREVDADGVPSIVVGYEDLLGAARVDVLFARETLRVLAVHGAGD